MILQTPSSATSRGQTLSVKYHRHLACGRTTKRNLTRLPDSTFLLLKRGCAALVVKDRFSIADFLLYSGGSSRAQPDAGKMPTLL